MTHKDAVAGHARFGGTASDTTADVRIVHLVPTDGIGGVEVAAQSMQMRKDLPCVFLLLFIMPPGSPARSFWQKARRAGLMFLSNIRAFREARAFAPHVIVCSLWRSVPLAIALRLTCRHARLAFFVHNDVTMHRLDALMSWLALRAADVIWGDSAATLATRGVPRRRSRVISFVTEHLTAPQRRRPNARFVSWGRLSRQKGIDRSIHLMAMLTKRGVDVEYDVFGPDGGELAALKALVQGLGLADRVRFPGPVSRSELTSIAERHSYYLQLSRSEGMCMAAVEAMQLGLVPVTTAVGEMAHYVVTNETGIQVDPNRLDIAVIDLVTLIADPHAWHRLSESAQRHWSTAPLYADDVCQAARALAWRGRDNHFLRD